MRTTLMALTCAGLLTLAGDGRGDKEAPADKDTTAFFNGKNLDGWEGLEGYWQVKDGAIVGASAKKIPFNTFLCSKKKYGDFQLSFQVRLKGGQGNSGVQVRSEVFDKEKLAVKGPQCDMGQIYWGSLYGEHFGGMMRQAPTATGKHVTIKLNGETTVDEEFAKMPADGIIAWQLHAGGPMEVTFRNIKFKDLGKK
jgi:hypothetical protein